MKNILWAIVAVPLCIFLPDRAESRYLEHVIRCESDGFSREQCRLPLAPEDAEIREIRMVRQLSTKPCIEGKTWQASYRGITVTNGCRADFRIVYEHADNDREDRYDRRHDSDDGDRGEWQGSPSFRQEDPNDIIIRAFVEILNRRPTREEMREYRYLIMQRDWSEHQVRRDLRQRSDSQGRY